ncbi:tRNA glutamyl-Q(34) synthetase GluQRS [Bifidobacterium pullorum subsp. saeculare]|uniref:tRNA glutamyl-Q(34) synthetase GluQRS n=1 Tax=Bifidobacterium pullorum subsp. saeculare TaxID=78257 RepID=A0A938WXI0_9BIFI|nr:glutamate--tRNA ligase family protein [Bifidobacterium pullorum]MBM6700104.1 tRNA glutamyl-Q(34) synthetase GluQRS [Bifidobacterium pullorum subsp. saeculare]
MTGRFAPTPSGRMHIGNAYAMLAAWLDARSRGERMVLRIEDIDRPRVLPDADRWIMDDLAWLGLDWDGEPVYQSARLDRYEEALRALEDRHPPLIYPCFCSRADIRAASAPQEGDGFQIYPGTCSRLWRDHPDQARARLARGDRHSLRIAMPDAGAAAFEDRVYGPQRYRLAHDIGDSVVRRADGLFAYQFVVTVDDLDMGVTSLVRGPSPAHPAHAHLPLIENAAGRRLAKRERSLDMGALRARGVLSGQVVGLCAWLLGLIPASEPCAPADLLDGFGWQALRAHHPDRILAPDGPHVPRWLAEALG